MYLYRIEKEGKGEGREREGRERGYNVASRKERKEEGIKEEIEENITLKYVSRKENKGWIMEGRNEEGRKGMEEDDQGGMEGGRKRI